MGETTDGEPAEGVRASDAERDAAVERLSQAAGEGRLTLEEFSERMDRATTARTRSELDRLVTDLPAGSEAGSAVTVGSQAGPSWHISPVGGLNVFGPWRMGRHVIVVSLIGGARLDLSQAELAAPEVTLTQVSLMGGVRARVPSGIRVEASGLSLIGGTRMEGAPDPGPGAPTIHIRAFSLVGGIRIRRDRPARRSRPDRPARPARRSRPDRLDRPDRRDLRDDRRDARDDRRDQRYDRRDYRRSRHDRFGRM